MIHILPGREIKLHIDDEDIILEQIVIYEIGWQDVAVANYIFSASTMHLVLLVLNYFTFLLLICSEAF